MGRRKGGVEPAPLVVFTSQVSSTFRASYVSREATVLVPRYYFRPREARSCKLSPEQRRHRGQGRAGHLRAPFRRRGGPLSSSYCNNSILSSGRGATYHANAVSLRALGSNVPCAFRGAASARNTEKGHPHSPRLSDACVRVLGRTVDRALLRAARCGDRVLWWLLLGRVRDDQIEDATSTPTARRSTGVGLQALSLLT